MVCVSPSTSNRPLSARWVQPPWTTDSPAWRAIDAKLPPDDLARKIEAVVALWDLTSLRQTYAGVGSRAYPPELLLKVALYEMQRGRLSPGQWWRDAHFDQAVQWLARGVTPARSRWYEFRNRLGNVLDQLHQQVLQQAIASGLTSAAGGVLDGTTVAANATRRHPLSARTLTRRQEQLEAAIAQDEEPTATVVIEVRPCRPVRRHPAWMAATPRGRRRQREAYRQARRRLDERLAENQRRRASHRQDPRRIKVAVGDPQAPIAGDKEKVVRPLYNLQVCTDLQSPLVLAWEVFAQASDRGLGPLMLPRHAALTGRPLRTLLVDREYVSVWELERYQEAGVTVYASWAEEPSPPSAVRQIPKSQFVWDAAQQNYVCPEGHRLTRQTRTRQTHAERESPLVVFRCPAQHCRACPRRPECTTSPQGRTVQRLEQEHLLEELRARMESPQAQALLELRRQTVEPCFADMKVHRGLRRFSSRTLPRVRIEAGLLLLAHNGLTLLNHLQSQDAAPATALHTAA